MKMFQNETIEKGVILSYQILSLKWRPQTFSEIEGQKPIQKILTQALQKKSLHPALIFSGTKGTGKTSTARIVAKSLRCEKKDSYEPCNKCASCLGINNGSDMNVIEIDGASHNGVDAIRNLKDSIQYMPSSGDKKIYIIDEVHMLSQSAFNALLKTLEEPPGHVIFIMATTELRKIPSTVLSRCQIFNFRPIPPALIEKRLQQICKAEKIQIDDEALWLIVEQSQQSMRDAQVLLDQMASFSNKKISSDMVINVLGLHNRSFLNSLVEAIVKKDSTRVLSFMPELAQINPEDFLNTFLTQIRNLLMIQVAKDPKWIFLMEAEKDFLEKLAKQTTAEDLHLLFDMCLKGRQDLRKSFDPHIALEMVLLRMSQAPRIESLFTNSTHLKKVENKKKESELVEKTLKTSVKKSQSETPDEKVQVQADIDSKKWKDFIRFIGEKDSRLVALMRSYSFCREENKVIVLGYPESKLFLMEKTKDLEFRKALEGYISQFFKVKMACRFIADSTDCVRNEENKERDKIQKQKLKKAESHPLAQKISHLFQAEAVSLDKNPTSK